MSCRWSGRMNSSECSCRPQTRSLQGRQDAFSRRYRDDDEALLESMSKAHPDGATSADLYARETSQQGKPPAHAGRMGRVFDFDKMVKAANHLLFDKRFHDGSALNSMNRPRYDRVPPEDLVLVQSFAELLFEIYRNGGCLRCVSLIKETGRDGEPGKEAELVLRALLRIFDQEGEPIPRELLAWSAKSRLENLPRRGRSGKPTTNWLRDSRINYTVAYLAYLTGMEPTHGASRQESILDAVKFAFQRNGFPGFSYEAARAAWKTPTDKETDVAQGPAMLELWRAQDRKAARAQRRRARLAYWQQQDWWHED